MGLFVNPSEASLRMAVRSKIYVDKSMILHALNGLLNTEGRFVCVSRARRFGKSMAGNMIAAYYSKTANSRPILEKLKIARTPDFETYLNAFNVIHIDMNACYSNSNGDEDIVPLFTSDVRRELIKQFPDCDIEGTDALPVCIQKIFSETGEQFVLVLDEYDVLVREKVRPAIFDAYLSFLNGMFKNANLAPAFALVYLTGILPIVRDKVQSKLNLFSEYTMTDARQLTEYVGFTEDEVRELCVQNDMDFEACRRWYNGYRMTDTCREKDYCLYNPKSVVEAMTARCYGDYWTQTSCYEAIKTYIMMNFEGIVDDVKAMIAGEHVDVNIYKYMNTMTSFHSKDDVFTYLIHLGYLGYDKINRRCYIPNYEIRSEWINAIEGESDYAGAMKVVNNSKRLLDRTVEGDAQAVADALAAAHEQLICRQRYNHEACLQSAIRFAYFYATSRYTIISELPGGKGYADVAFVPYIPNVPAMIVELKRNRSTGAALHQIESKEYFNVLDKYQGDLLLVAVNYDEKTNAHACEIRRFEK